MDELFRLDWQKLHTIIIHTFDIPENLQSVMLEDLEKHDHVGLEAGEEKNQHDDGCSDWMIYCFDYLLFDRSARSWGFISDYMRNIYPKEKR